MHEMWRLHLSYNGDSGMLELPRMWDDVCLEKLRQQVELAQERGHSVWVWAPWSPDGATWIPDVGYGTIEFNVCRAGFQSCFEQSKFSFSFLLFSHFFFWNRNAYSGPLYTRNMSPPFSHDRVSDPVNLKRHTQMMDMSTVLSHYRLRRLLKL